jgi:hypothetical protein
MTSEEQQRHGADEQQHDDALELNPDTVRDLTVPDVEADSVQGGAGGTCNPAHHATCLPL